MPDRGLTHEVAQALILAIDSALGAVRALQEDIAVASIARDSLFDEAAKELRLLGDALVDLVHGAPFEPGVWELLEKRLPEEQG